ncbi:MAG: DDE transposase family protein, partial [Prevotellaceae bacterium]|nr:DDE transposase family protein [Prevotellaceae bacterium]
LKNNPLQEYHGAMFDLTQPQCNDWVHLLIEILRKTLKSLCELPERNAYRAQHILRQYDNVLLDGTERPIQRQQDSDRQKSCYSGKKNS